MRQITRMGLDIAKRWFQIHAVDGEDREVLNRKLPRDKVLGFLASLPPCDIALEACSSSHQHPSDAELASVIKMKMNIPVICSMSKVSAGHPKYPQSSSGKSDIGNAVAKVLQGYDWSLVPLASR